MLVLDAHAHCGITLPFEQLHPRWQEGDIDGGVLFAPVEEIYDRYDPDFTDREDYRHSRSKVHSLLESLLSERIFAFWLLERFELPGMVFRELSGTGIRLSPGIIIMLRSARFLSSMFAGCICR